MLEHPGLCLATRGAGLSRDLQDHELVIYSPEARVGAAVAVSSGRGGGDGVGAGPADGLGG